MRGSFWVSLFVFIGLIVISAVLTRGRFVFGFFLFPLGLLPLLFRSKDKN
ncbi:MAG TPA: hypothetical protein GXZ82_04250 [Firmicutes bacterium]|nr:hypothetical protein [Bacillota bacterium]